MTGGRRRKLLISVLVLVGTSATIDALLGRGQPRTAKATTVTETTPAEPGTDIEVLLTRLQGQTQNAPAMPLAALPRNPFEPTDAFEPSAATASDAPEAELAAPRIDHGEAFRGAHTLTGTMVGPRPTALLDGRVIEVGTQLDGFTVVEIARGRVVWHGHDTTVTLTVQE